MTVFDTLYNARRSLWAELYEGQGTRPRDEVNADLARLNDRIVAAHRSYDAAFRQMVGQAPTSIRPHPYGGLMVSKGGAGWGSCSHVPATDPRFPALKAELERREKVDKQVAEFCYAQWGTTCPVRMDYYGDWVWVYGTGGRKRCVKPADVPELATEYNR